MFTAGSDSTSVNIRWGLLYMIANPDVQAKAQKELDKVVGRDRMPRLSDKADLPYFQATLLEITRKASTARLSALHAASEDTTLNGYNIPKGAIVMANLWACHYDAEVFAEPEVFRPERFLNDAGDKVVQRDELIPFSTGRRFCLGDNLARMELFVIISHLLHRFTFKSPPDQCTALGMARLPNNVKICAIQRE
ncbi:cytochrome P450 2U1-like [Amphiura filiformis]|uniref:cytochrome P450 2U1-like n=1 Tax=Amphiura filiformis TaxID=82378 RepID=UPI003B216D6E